MDFLSKFQKYNFPTLGYIKMPKIAIPEKDIKELGLSKDSGPDEYLSALAIQRYDEKWKLGLIPKDKEKEYAKRTKEELETITTLGFSSYILLVYQIIQFCKSNGIPNSPARGSVGGSLVCWLIDVIQIDPIKHNLLFSRFLSATRAEKKEINGEIYIKSDSLPDVDLDSSHFGKPLVRKELERLFPERTVSISTVSTFSSKVLIKEVLKTYNEVSEPEAQSVSEMIDREFGKVPTILESIEKFKAFGKWAKQNEEVIKIACCLQDLVKNRSVHAAGVLLTNEPVKDVLPLETDKNGELVCGYEMEAAQMFGIKMDNLAVLTLDICKDCADLVGISLDKIDVNHSSIYEFLNKTDNYYGLFQVSEGLGKNTLIKIKPQNIEDIVVSVALGRPGSMKWIDEFVENKFDIEQLDPRVKEILRETHGIIVYQETLMQLAMVMADFTPQDANNLRKGIGKKIKEKVMAFKEKFITNSIKNGFKEDFVNWCWDSIQASADYSFARAHATGYGYLVGISSFLKANYPKQFFLSCLKHLVDVNGNPLEELSKIHSELNYFGITLLPPHILKSDIDFTIEGDSLRYGLGQIKNIAEKSIEKLNKFKHQYSNKFEIFQAANEAKIPISILISLILVGSLDDEIKESRSKTVLEAQLWNLLTDKEKGKAKELGESNSFDLIAIIKKLNKETKDEKGRPIIKDSRLNTIRKDFKPYHDMYLFNKKNEKLANFYFESELLGYSYSTKLIDIYSEFASDLINVQEVIARPEDSRVHFVGRVQEVKEGIARNEKKTKYLKCIVKDETGSCTTMLFNDRIEQHKEENGKKVEENDIVVVRGRRKGDAVFADVVGIQDINLFRKISDLKNIEKPKSIIEEIK